jgi:branched-chain amino acid transport system substrate-binding protein
MIADAVNKAGSTDPMKVALAMEGIEVTDPAGETAIMRPTDHQVMMTYYSVSFSTGVKYDSEKTGLGWKTDAVVKIADLDQPTTCKMKRPMS